MGNFLSIVAQEPLAPEATSLFDHGLRVARSLRNPEPGKKVRSAGLYAASFPRRNGSGGLIAEDEQTGDWLLAVGSWFYSSGLGPGDERHLLKCYKQFGAMQLARELEGFFTIVIGDARESELIVITDVVGSCHAFWRQLPQATVLSGSSLMLAKLQECTIDPVACQEFVHTGNIYEDRTLFAEVRKLAPATVFWFSGAKLKKQERYWNPAALKPESLRGDSAVDMLFNSLRASVTAITRVFPNPVCDLTGGYDSRAVAAAFMSVGVKFAATVSGAAASADVAVSKSLAAMLKLQHLHFPPHASCSYDEIQQALFLTDGECDLIDYARVSRIHRVLANQFQISINGSFGELARGYWWELLVPHTGRPSRLDASKLAQGRYLPNRVLFSLFRPNVRIAMLPHFVRVIEQNNGDLLAAPNTYQMDAAYLGLRMQRWQGRIATSTNRLWPCLSPFIFRSTLDVILQTENQLRKRSLMVRKMLYSHSRSLAEFPLEHGYPAVPAAWDNLHRFALPLLAYYGTKVLQRVGVSRHNGALPQPEGKSARLALWEEPQVKSLLQPDSLKSSELLDPGALRTFLARSQQPDFSAESEWRRLLAMECAFYEAEKRVDL